VSFTALDVTSAEAWSDLEGRLRSQFGALHVPVNNAGIALRRPSMSAVALDDWNRVLAVNLTGPFLGIRTLAPLIRDSGGGAIVNTGSAAGVTGHFATAYTASKWGLRGLTKSAAMEFADWGIRVNAVHPGIVMTPIVKGSDDFVEAMEWMTPQGRAGSARRYRERGGLPGE
jgi:NAD(P)-dependent dehydrogenase (short-subunit alcohol dehydrogenase family)